MNPDFKITMKSDYKGWTLEEVYESDIAYLFYLIHTHKVPDAMKKLIIDFLYSKPAFKETADKLNLQPN